MKKVLECEVTGLFDDNRNGVSVFRNTLEDDPGCGLVYKELKFDLAQLYPGTVITIHHPECPSCKAEPAAADNGICPCGHDWVQWSNDQSKDVLWRADSPETASKPHE